MPTVPATRRVQARVGIVLAAVAPLAAAFWLRFEAGSTGIRIASAFPAGSLVGILLGLALAVGTGSLSAWVMGPALGLAVGVLDLYACFGLTAWLGVPSRWAAAVPVWGLAAGLLAAADRRATSREGARMLLATTAADFAGRWLGRWVLLAQSQGMTTAGVANPWAAGLAYLLPSVTLAMLATRPLPAPAPADGAPGSARPWLSAGAALSALVVAAVLWVQQWYGNLPPPAGGLEPGTGAFAFAFPLPRVRELGEAPVRGIAEQGFAQRGLALEAGHSLPAVDGAQRLTGYDPARRVGYQEDMVLDGAVGADVAEGAKARASIRLLSDAAGRPVFVLQLEFAALTNATRSLLPGDSGPRGMLGVDPARAAAAQAGSVHHHNLVLAALVETRVREFLEEVERQPGK